MTKNNDNKSIYSKEELVNFKDVIFRLESVREEKSLEKKDFAKLLNISKQIYNNICFHSRGIKLEELFLLDKNFDVDLHWLITGKEKNRSEFNDKKLELLSDVNKYFADQNYSQDFLLNNLFKEIIYRMQSNTLTTKIFGENNRIPNFFISVIIDNENSLLNSRYKFIEHVKNIDSISRSNREKLIMFVEKLPEEDFLLILKYKKKFIEVFLNSVDIFARKVFFSKAESFVKG